MIIKLPVDKLIKRCYSNDTGKAIVPTITHKKREFVMIYGLKEIRDIRNANRTAMAISAYMDKWASKKVDKNGYVLSRKKNKSNNPFEGVFPAGPIAGKDSKYSVRISLPLDLKQYAGSRYGCWAQTGQPNGFEYVGFRTVKEGCEFVKTIRDLAVAGDVNGFTNWLDAGDGSNRFYEKKNSINPKNGRRRYHRNAQSFIVNNQC